MPLSLAAFTQAVVDFGSVLMISAARLAHVQDGAALLVPSGYQVSRYTNIPVGTALTATQSAISGITTTVSGTNAQIEAAVVALQAADLINVQSVNQAAANLLDATPSTVASLLQTYITAIQTAAPVDAINLLFSLANSIPITSNTQTFSRASTATYLNTSGIIQQVAANVLRNDSFFPLNNSSRPQNMVRNSTMQGLLTGTPGVLPTNWLLSTTTGLTVQIIGSGTVNGLPYMDIQFAGTATSGTGRISLFPDDIQVVANQTWTSSFYTQVIAGTTSNVYSTLYAFDVNGNPLGNTSTPLVSPSTLTRTNSTITTPANSASLIMAMEINEQIGTPINVTIRYAAPQLELGTSPSTFMSTPVTRPSLPLIENQATNLTIASAAIGGSAWSKTATTITTNAAIAPDGSLTASHVAETTANSQHNVAETFTSVIGLPYTLSVSAKAAEYTQTLLSLGGITQAIFDLKMGTVVSSTGTVAYIQSLSNGWYRIGLTANATSTTSQIIITPSNNLGVYSGINGNGVFMWGSQVEQAPSESSYIPTTTVAVTRAADNISFQSFDSPYVLAMYALVLCALGDAIVNYTPQTSNEAVGIVNQFIALFDAAIVPASDLDMPTNSLRILRAKVLAYLQNQIAIEPKVLTQTFNDSLPASAAAFAIYGNATKKALLIQQNNPADPLSMPTNLLYDA